jgi:hypothetical protein
MKDAVLITPASIATSVAAIVGAAIASLFLIR